MEIKVGEIIRAKREDRKLSLVKFAEIIGISPGYLSQLENGRKANPNLEIILKIIRELEIDIDMLLGVDDADGGTSVKIPSLLKLVVARDRNIKVLEDKEALKKICSIVDKALDCKYMIEDKSMYELFLEDIYIQIETILKRYMAIQIIRDVM